MKTTQNKNEKAVSETAQEIAKVPAEKSSVKSLLDSPQYQNRLRDLLNDRAPQFITSVIQLVNNDKALRDCEPNTIINAALVATSLDLPINKNLGFAYVIPYNNKQSDGTYRKEAQFQLGYKGYKQLAQRTGRFSIINQTDVRDGEIVNMNRLTGEIEFNWINDINTRLETPVIGYVSYFRLTNGFSSTFYMTIQELEAHALKYSKGYAADMDKLKFAPNAYVTNKWITDRGAMSEKTVIKLNLDKNAPLSVEDKNFEALRLAIKSDQAVISDFEKQEFDYVDNETQEAEFSEVDLKSKADAAMNATIGKLNLNEENE